MKYAIDGEDTMRVWLNDNMGSIQLMIGDMTILEINPSEKCLDFFCSVEGIGLDTDADGHVLVKLTKK